MPRRKLDMHEIVDAYLQLSTHETVDKDAAKLGISPPTLYKYLKQANLSAKKCKKGIVVLEESLKRPPCVNDFSSPLREAADAIKAKLRKNFNQKE